MNSDYQSYNAKICVEVAEGNESPFSTLEAAHEHCGMLWGWYRKQGYSLPELKNGQKVIVGSVGDFDHELHVIETYIQKANSVISALLPDLYAYVEYHDQSALNRVIPHLLALAEMHEKQYRKMMTNVEVEE